MLAAVKLHREGDPFSRTFHPAHLRSGDDAQPFLLEDLGEGPGDFRLVAGENALAARDERHLGAKASKHLAQFERNVAPSQDEQGAGLLAQFGSPAVIGRTQKVTGEVWNIREARHVRNGRQRAGRDQNLPSDQVAWAIGALHLDYMVGEKPCLARHELDALRFIEQALVLVGAVLLDDLIFLSDEFCPVDRHVNRCEARIAWMGGIVDEAGRFNQVLGGQAAPVGAGAADRAEFGHDSAFAEFGSVQRRGKGGRAAAQNHQAIALLR